MAISDALGGADSELYFDARATEAQLKGLNETGGLAAHRLLLFATHGLAPGDIGSAEPALVLTPPDEATPTDDGLGGRGGQNLFPGSAWLAKLRFRTGSATRRIS